MLSYQSYLPLKEISLKNGCDEDECERKRLCGNLFSRKTNISHDILNEFFRQPPCPYTQNMYKNASRIFNCLKVDLNENQLLKSLKQQRLREKSELERRGRVGENGLNDSNESSMSNDDDHEITEVPRINYESVEEKRTTLQLAFSTLKFQKVLEDLLETCQFYVNHPHLKDEQSLVCTVLFDYMMRKFQLRDRLTDEPYDNYDWLVTQIENSLYSQKTDFAAEIARNRIREDSLTLDGLLPRELREVEHHRAELPIYCWVNQLKMRTQQVIDDLVGEDELTLVDCKDQLDRKCFMLDPHCANVLMFHYTLRDKLNDHELVKNFKMIIQDKSSCLAPHTVRKLMSKRDDVIVTNISGGMVAAFIGCMMEEFDGKVYVFGAVSDEKYDEISAKYQQIGCYKYVRIMREEFVSLREGFNPETDKIIESAKIILMNAPCSKSALMNPMDFLFQEGEDVKHLRDYTLDVNNEKRVKKCIQNETAILKHALNFNSVRAVVYQTYSKNAGENELLASKCLVDFNEARLKTVFPYKLSSPLIPLTSEDIQKDEVTKDAKFLKFKPSSKMNGCFVALFIREKDANVDRELRKSGVSSVLEKKHASASTAQLQQQSAKRTKSPPTKFTTFQEKNYLKKVFQVPSKRLANIRRKSYDDAKNASVAAAAVKLSKAGILSSLEHEIRQMQLNGTQAKHSSASNSNLAASNSNSRQQNQNMPQTLHSHSQQQQQQQQQHRNNELGGEATRKTISSISTNTHQPSLACSIVEATATTTTTTTITTTTTPLTATTPATTHAKTAMSRLNFSRLDHIGKLEHMSPTGSSTPRCHNKLK